MPALTLVVFINAMMRAKRIFHVTHDHTFDDEYLFYRVNTSPAPLFAPLIKITMVGMMDVIREKKGLIADRKYRCVGFNSSIFFFFKKSSGDHFLF